jgi:hypothetical protein
MRNRQQSLRWALIMFLGVHFLSLCTINSQVHADLIRQAAQTHHTAGHCSHPSAGHESTHRPICCNLEQNHKAASLSLISTIPAPMPALLSVLVDSDVMARGLAPLRFVPILHSSHSPPLYLLHAVLLV